MKKLTFLVLLLLIVKVSFGQWQGIDYIAGSSAEIVFKTSQNVFAISEEGNGVFKSSDNGLSFERVLTFYVNPVEADPLVKDVFVFGDTIIIGKHNAIVRSNNNGVDWQVYSIPENANRFFFFNGILYFNDALNYSNLYKSDDKGQTWQTDVGILSNMKISTSTVHNNELFFSSDVNKAIYKLSNNYNIELLFNPNIIAKKIILIDDNITILGLDSIFLNHFISWNNGDLLLDNVLPDKANDMFANGDTIWITYNDSIVKTYDLGLTFHKVNGFNDVLYYQSYTIIDEYEYINSKWGLFQKQRSANNWNKSLLSYPIKYVFDFNTSKVKNTIILYNPNDKILSKQNIGEPISTHFCFNNSSGVYELNICISDNLVFGFNHNVGLLRSTNLGDTWTQTTHNITGFTQNSKTFFQVLKNNNENLMIINKFPNEFYILRSLDAGNTWNNIYIGNGVLGRINYSYFKIKEDTICIAGKDILGGFVRYKCSYANGQVGQFLPLHIPIEPIGSVMYRQYFDFPEMFVERSLDMGITWNRGYGINYPPYSGQMYFCGNDSVVFCHINEDVYASKNKGFSWFSINGNISDKKISSIFFNNDTLYAATVRDSLYFMKVSNVVPRIVSGKVFFDNNGNNSFDQIFDIPIPYIHIYSVSTGSSAFSDSLGNYQLMLSHSTSNDTVRALNTFLYTNVTPIQYVMNQTDSLKNFAFNRLHSKNDLRVDITSIDIPRPGFLYHVFITCKNEGTTTLNGNLILNHNPFFQYMLSTIAPAQINQGSVVWNFNNFEPLQSYSFYVKFRIDSTTSIIGLPVQMTATIFPILGDETPDNNTDSLSNIVVGSFDPNDKTVNRSLYLSPQQVLNKSEMIYTVRFQNTGTWYAENVSILDTLHRNLDWSTFRVISSSHDCNFNFSGNGVVQFNFPNINLPDSNMNEAESHGFIKYAVRLNNSITLNDSIINTAYIYFDYNEPIVTNTALNIVRIDAAVNENPNEFNLSVYPNPAKTSLNIRFEKSSSYNLTLFSMDGRIVLNEKSNSEHHVLNIASLDKGIYLLKVADTTKSKLVKVVIQ